MFKPGDTVGVCDSCGTRQTLSELDKDSMPQSANKPLSAEEINVSALLERIFFSWRMEIGRWLINIVSVCLIWIPGMLRHILEK